MRIDEHLQFLRGDGEAMAGIAERAGLDAVVPPCPGWRVRDVLLHLGGVHRWAAAHVSERRERPIGPEEESRFFESVSDDALIDWFRSGHSALVGTLTGADPALACWSFLPAPSPLAFWTRRQAHETAVHRADVESAVVRRADVESAVVRRADVESAVVRRADVESAAVRRADVESAAGRRTGPSGRAGYPQAAGRPQGTDMISGFFVTMGQDGGPQGRAGAAVGRAAFAVDGVEELLRGFFARRPERLTCEPPVAIALSATDVEAAWTVRMDGGGLHVSDGAGPATLALSGTAADLYLLLWNRIGPEKLTAEGDLGALDVWRARATVKWS